MRRGQCQSVDTSPLGIGKQRDKSFKLESFWPPSRRALGVSKDITNRQLCKQRHLLKNSNDQVAKLSVIHIYEKKQNKGQGRWYVGNESRILEGLELSTLIILGFWSWGMAVQNIASACRFLGWIHVTASFFHLWKYWSWGGPVGDRGWIYIELVDVSCDDWYDIRNTDSSAACVKSSSRSFISLICFKICKTVWSIDSMISWHSIA